MKVFLLSLLYFFGIGTCVKSFLFLYWHGYVCEGIFGVFVFVVFVFVVVVVVGGGGGGGVVCVCVCVRA